jgi:hypothetical protein
MPFVPRCSDWFPRRRIGSGLASTTEGGAQAAQAATKRVSTLVRREKEQELLELVQRMGREAAEGEQRCEKAAGTRDGMKTAIITKKSRETKAELTTFMKTYLEDAEALDGLEFLSMAEAGEMAHWEILGTLNDNARDRTIAELVKFALPLQRGHVDAIRDSSLRLAAAGDPSEEA